MKKEKFYIDYYSAIHWLNPGLVPIYGKTLYKIDPDFYFEDQPVDEDENPVEIFEYILTTFNCDEVTWMKEHFPDIVFGYSEVLDTWIIGVDHLGTPWCGVWTECRFDPEYDIYPKIWDEKEHAQSETKRSYTTYWSKNTF